MQGPPACGHVPTLTNIYPNYGSNSLGTAHLLPCRFCLFRQRLGEDNSRQTPAMGKWPHCRCAKDKVQHVVLLASYCSCTTSSCRPDHPGHRISRWSAKCVGSPDCAPTSPPKKLHAQPIMSLLHPHHLVILSLSSSSLHKSRAATD